MVAAATLLSATAVQIKENRGLFAWKGSAMAVVR